MIHSPQRALQRRKQPCEQFLADMPPAGAQDIDGGADFLGGDEAVSVRRTEDSMPFSVALPYSLRSSSVYVHCG